MNQKEKKEVSELSEAEFMKRWTARSKDLDAVKEDCRWFREQYDLRQASARVQNMTEAERDSLRAALDQSVTPDGVESEEAVHNG